MSPTLLTQEGLNPGRGVSPGDTPKRVLALPAKWRRAFFWHPPDHPCLGCTEPARQKLASAASGGSRRIRSCFLFVFEMSGLLIVRLNEVSKGLWVTKKYEW